MEIPEGYRLVRIGKVGRKPTLQNKAESELTSQQLRMLKWRQAHVKERKEYNKMYYERKKQQK